MIIVSKCPYRISLIGGSSDLDWFVNRKGRGFSIGFAVSSYSRVIVGYRGGNNSRGLLNYSSREEYLSIDSISHPIIRKCLQKFDFKEPIELASFGESLLGGGLASSSSFVVALIKSLTKLKNEQLSNEEIAKLACSIEFDESNGAMGRQDQYLCALGGVNFLSFEKNGIVKRKNYPIVSEAICKYCEEIYLINTSISRSAQEQLTIIKNDPHSYSCIEQILDIAEGFIDEVKDRKDVNSIIQRLEIAIRKSWEIKKDMKGVLNSKLKEIQNLLIEKNFDLIKILGAGGGGYFLAKYNGKNIEEITKELTIKNIYIKKITIDLYGCQSWEI